MNEDLMLKCLLSSITGKHEPKVVTTNSKWYSMYKADNSYTIILKLPGCIKETIKIQLEKQLLTINAIPSFDIDGKVLSKGECLITNAEITKTFDISYLLEDYNLNNIKSSYIDGVLTIIFNKKDRVVKTITID